MNQQPLTYRVACKILQEKEIDEHQLISLCVSRKEIADMKQAAINKAEQLHAITYTEVEKAEALEQIVAWILSRKYWKFDAILKPIEQVCVMDMVSNSRDALRKVLNDMASLESLQGKINHWCQGRDPLSIKITISIGEVGSRTYRSKSFTVPYNEYKHIAEKYWNEQKAKQLNLFQ